MENTFLYFAYGSNLKKALMEFRVNEPVTTVGHGVLHNYALCFNRQNTDGTARANIIPSDTETTHGILYSINKQHFELLAQTEPRYQLIALDVETAEGIKNAFAFVCDDCTDEIVPTEEYLKTIIEGAEEHELPENYIVYLKHKAGIA